MALNFNVAATAQTAGLNAYADAVGELLHLGTREIRTGAPSTENIDADIGTLLATLRFSDPPSSRPSPANKSPPPSSGPTP